MRRVSLVLVAHRSSAVLPSAVASFRVEAARAGVEPEVVVVEQSEDREEARRASDAGPDHLLELPNRGYAAGLNTGIAVASGEVLALANPDLRFERGSLGALLEALEAGWDVVGPQFTLADLLLPPADVQTPAEEIYRFAASRSPLAWRRFMRREVSRWRRVWEAAEPLAVGSLSGALVVVPAAVARRVGAWDEGYFLYYEETDWLRRARRLGLGTAVVPAARVEHAWGHAADPASAPALMGESRSRFYARCFGPLGRSVARLRLDRTPLAPAPFASSAAHAFPPDALWLVSPTPWGFPAAGRRSPRPPARELDVLARSSPQCRDLTVLAWDTAAGRCLGVWSWRAAG